MSCVFIGPLFQAPLFPRDILVYRNSNCCQNYRSDICQQCRRDDIKIPAYFQNFIQCLLIANISMIFFERLQGNSENFIEISTVEYL
jgi:hypothetical protein